MKVREQLKHILKALGIPENEADDTGDGDLFNRLRSIVGKHVKTNLASFNLNAPTIEGESKKIYRWKKLALIELKPTMYSFTHNRYGEVKNTDQLRLDFWGLFGSRLNSMSSRSLLGDNGPFSEEFGVLFKEGTLEESFPFISNYLGEIQVDGKRYAIVRFAEEIPPLEVIWKNYLVGTMKHNLKTVDEHPTRKGAPIQYEGVLPRDIIRFDWRNPLPDKDECIPDEFADLYMDTRAARMVARLASRMLNFILQEAGYELVDLCYFMNYEGTCIHSEITPDGMRIRKQGVSFDKDLWRAGKDGTTINKVWKVLYQDIGGEDHETGAA